jgi:hypothetical protein
VSKRILSVSKRILSGLKRYLSVSKRILSGLKRYLPDSKRILSVSKRYLSDSKRILSGPKRYLSVSKRILSVLKRILSGPGYGVFTPAGDKFAQNIHLRRTKRWLRAKVGSLQRAPGSWKCSGFG